MAGAPERHPLPAEEGRRRTSPLSWRRLSLDVAIAYIAAWAVGIGFGLGLAGTRGWRQGAGWERATLRWAHTHVLPHWLDRVLLAVPLAGTNAVVLPVMLLVAAWLWRKRHEPVLGLQLVVVSAGAFLLNPAMKYLFDRLRPALYPLRGMYFWASYPSGHAILSTALFFTIALLLHRARGWRWPFVVAAALVLITCYSRLYLAVHWPTDIIGGLLIGVVWLLGTWLAFQHGTGASRLVARRLGR